MNFLKKHGHWIVTLFAAFVFIQSLFFKFTGRQKQLIYLKESLTHAGRPHGF